MYDRTSTAGLTPSEIAAFVSFPLDTVEKDLCCVICQDDLKLNDLVKRLPCNHCCYHATCIEAWLARSSTCPVCNFNTRSNPTDVLSNATVRESDLV